MKEIEVKTVKYACDNCGAEHDYPQEIKKCKYSGKEFCNKCKCIVRIYNPYVHKWIDVYVHPAAYVHGYDKGQMAYYEQMNALYEEYELAQNELEQRINAKFKAINEKYIKGEFNV